MEGPSSAGSFVLEPDRREILWITRYRIDVVGADGELGADLSEFLCHNNLEFDSKAHKELFGLTRPMNFGRMFTASQGVFEIDLPAGFGIPVLSDETLEASTTALNLNRENPDLEVRHRMTLEYVRDSDARGTLKPLYPTFTSVMALVHGKDGFFDVAYEPSEAQSGSSCAPGEVAPNAPDKARFHHDHHGRLFTQHWVVPPGREERRTLVTTVINVPFPTTVHYVVAHLHPFAKSIELRDLTTGETVVRLEAEGPETGMGLARVETFSSVEGVPVYPDRDYEVISVYDNTTDVNQDAMATLFIYFYDEEMDRKLEPLRRRLAAGVEVASGT